MNKTKIEWCDRTTNPIYAIRKDTGARGWHCEKPDKEACLNCYAEVINNRFGTGLAYDAHNREAIEWRINEKELTSIFKTKEPLKIFWHDMIDVFQPSIPPHFIHGCLNVIEKTPQHTHIWLTKYPHLARKILSEHYGGDNLYPNLILMTSVSDQRGADQRIPELLRCPAAVRGISYEPALGPIEFWGSGWLEQPYGLDWIICGGESGPKARPLDLAWVHSAIAQCKAARVKVFVKQLGSRWVKDNVHLRITDPVPDFMLYTEVEAKYRVYPDSKGGNPSFWPVDLRVREWPEERA